LMTKLEQELPKWAKYVSYVFSVKDWKWEVFFDKEKETDNKIYVCIK
jgi:hypothetical protein